MDQLPNEIIHHVLQWLDPNSAQALHQTSLEMFNRYNQEDYYRARLRKEFHWEAYPGRINRGHLTWRKMFEELYRSPRVPLIWNGDVYAWVLLQTIDNELLKYEILSKKPKESSHWIFLDIHFQDHEWPEKLPTGIDRILMIKDDITKKEIPQVILSDRSPYMIYGVEINNSLYLRWGGISSSKYPFGIPSTSFDKYNLIQILFSQSLIPKNLALFLDIPLKEKKEFLIKAFPNKEIIQKLTQKEIIMFYAWWRYPRNDLIEEIKTYLKKIYHYYIL